MFPKDCHTQHSKEGNVGITNFKEYVRKINCLSCKKISKMCDHTQLRE